MCEVLWASCHFLAWGFFVFHFICETQSFALALLFLLCLACFMVYAGCIHMIVNVIHCLWDLFIYDRFLTQFVYWCQLAWSFSGFLLFLLDCYRLLSVWYCTTSFLPFSFLHDSLIEWWDLCCWYMSGGPLVFCLIFMCYVCLLIDESLNLDIEITTSLSLHAPYRMFIAFLL